MAKLIIDSKGKNSKELMESLNQIKKIKGTILSEISKAKIKIEDRQRKQNELLVNLILEDKVKAANEMRAEIAKLGEEIEVYKLMEDVDKQKVSQLAISYYEKKHRKIKPLFIAASEEYQRCENEINLKIDKLHDEAKTKAAFFHDKKKGIENKYGKDSLRDTDKLNKMSLEIKNVDDQANEIISICKKEMLKLSTELSKHPMNEVRRTHSELFEEILGYREVLQQIPWGGKGHAPYKTRVVNIER